MLDLDSELQHVRVASSQLCRRLLYVFVLSANANVVAQALLFRLYRFASQVRFADDDLLLTLVGGHLRPADWAHCMFTCRRFFSRFAQDLSGLAHCWFRRYSESGRKEAIRYIIEQNVVALVRPVIEATANVNCRDQDSFFRTPLHRAASRGHVEVCRHLLLLRADPSQLDSHGIAPIHLVASKGLVPIVDLLLRHHPSSIDVLDFHGRTPCHMAALKGHLAVLRRLVEARAAPDVQTLGHRTPVDMARRGQHSACIQYLEDVRRNASMPVARHVLGTLFQRALLVGDDEAG